MKKQEAQRPRGPRYPKGPKHTETPLTRCYHNEDLIPTELSNTTLDLRGPEAQRPRGPEAKWQKKTQRTKIPRGPKSPEAQRPRAPKAQRPKRPEAQEAHTSPTNVYPKNLQTKIVEDTYFSEIHILGFITKVTFRPWSGITWSTRWAE